MRGALLLAMAGLAWRAWACEPVAVAAAGAHDLPGAHGSTVALDGQGCWQGGRWQAGLARHDIGGTRWSTLRLGGALVRHDWTFGLAATLGPGSAPGGDFDYRAATATVERNVAANAQARLEWQAFDVGALRLGMARAVLSMQPAPAWQVEFSAAHSISGNFRVRLAGMRLDWLQAWGRAFAGVAGGRQFSTVFDVAGAAPRRRSTQWFGGVALPVGRHEFIAAAEGTQGAGARRLTLTGAFAWRFR